MKLLLPLLLAVIGLSAGAGAGLFLGSGNPDCGAPPCEEAAKTQEEAEKPAQDEPEYVRLQNQFVIPVVRDELVRSLVVMSLSLETRPGVVDSIYSKEPKLRDALLRVLFDHAHMGGFDGAFTESGRLSALRVALLEAAQSVNGRDISDILITDIVRQEM